MISLELRLFAILREHAGRDRLTLEVPEGTTAGALKDMVRAAAPALGPYMDATRVAVNLAFAPADQVLTATDDVALIPPVGGG
jgi:molybdopterin synthase catalytic subunit